MVRSVTIPFGYFSYQVNVDNEVILLLDDSALSSNLPNLGADTIKTVNSGCQTNLNF